MSKAEEMTMDFEKLYSFVIVYGYSVPIAIIFVWTIWCVYTAKRKGRKKISRILRDSWIILIPGVALLDSYILLMMAIENFYSWFNERYKG